MVTRILSGTSIRGLLNYNESKVNHGDATLIMASRFGVEIEQLTPALKLARFEHLTKLNGRVKTNAMHIMLNFYQSDVLGISKLQNIAKDYMNGIDYGEQPYLVYFHKDANHPHLHIVTTNIQSDGKRKNTQNIGKDLSESIRKQIEVDYGLIKAEAKSIKFAAKAVSVKIVDADYSKRPTKSSIYNVVTAVIRDYGYTSFIEYNTILGEFNVTADRGMAGTPMFEKGGLVYSIIDKSGNRVGIPFKASALAGNPGLKNIEKHFKNGVKRKAENILMLKSAIDAQLNNKLSVTRKALKKQLQEKGIGIIFRENSSGFLYGVTYVDHNSKTVFNGSELGKGYSAKGILERIHQNSNLVEIVDVNQAKKGKDVLENHSTIKPYHNLSATMRGLEVLLEMPAFDPFIRLDSKRKKRKKKGHQKTII